MHSHPPFKKLCTARTQELPECWVFRDRVIQLTLQKRFQIIKMEFGLVVEGGGGGVDYQNNANQNNSDPSD